VSDLGNLPANVVCATPLTRCIRALKFPTDEQSQVLCLSHSVGYTKVREDRRGPCQWRPSTCSGRDRPNARAFGTVPTDFTVLIEGGIGPQPHPGFIEVSDPPTLRGDSGEVAGAGKDGTM
jgi:hypothetical protein